MADPLLPDGAGSTPWGREHEAGAKEHDLGVASEPGQVPAEAPRHGLAGAGVDLAGGAHLRVRARARKRLRCRISTLASPSALGTRRMTCARVCAALRQCATRQRSK